MKENSGNISRVSLPRLLNLIYKKADAFGVLEVSKDPVKKCFYFKDGFLVSSTSNMLNEVLGRILMQDGILSLKDYEKSLEAAAREKKRHGEVLISMGILTEAELRQFLTTQLKNRLLKIFGWNEGEFGYSRPERPPQNISDQPLHPGHLILEGISLGYYPVARLDAELETYMDKTLSPVTAGLKCRPEDLRLNIQEERFLASFDGKKTLQEVLEGSNLLMHRASSLALSFIITGMVNGLCAEEAEGSIEGELKETPAVEAGGARRLNAELLFAKAKGAILADNFSDALKMLEQIVELNPLEAEYWAYLGWAVFNENPANAKKAEKIIKDAIDLNNDIEAAWHFLGMVFLRAGDAVWAEKAFRTAFQKNPWMLESLAEIKRLEIKTSLKGPDRGAYLNALGFLEDPFTAAPEQRFLAASGGREKTLGALLEGIKKNIGPLLVEGPDGAGKTTLLIELIKKLSNEKILCACIVKPEEKEIQLIQAINAELGVKKGKGTVKEELLNLGLKVSQNKVRGGHTIIIIDNAETLSRGCLKFIQYLTRLKTLQTVLFARTSFADKISRDIELKELKEKLAQNNIFSIEGFTADETRSFVLKRLENSKSTGEINFEDLLDPTSIALIHEKSKGLPAGILSASAALFRKKAEETVFSAPATASDAMPAEETKAQEEKLLPGVAEHPRSFEENFSSEDSAPPMQARPEETLESIKEPVEAGQDYGQEIPAPPSSQTKEIRREFVPEKPPVRPAKAVQEIGTPDKKTMTEKKPRQAVLRLAIIVIAMIVLGLVIGSLIGINWPFVGAPKKTEPEPSVLKPSPPVITPSNDAQVPQPETQPDNAPPATTGQNPAIPQTAPPDNPPSPTELPVPSK